MQWDFDPCAFDKKYYRDKYDGTIILFNDVPMSIQMHDASSVIGEEAYNYSTSGVELGIKPFLPNSQWFMDDVHLKTPVYMRRVPRRQWHRSFHREQYEFSIPYLHGFRLRNNMPNFGSQVSTARAVHNNTTMKLEEAVKLLRKNRKHGGEVLTKDFALIRNSETVYSLCNSVGIVALVLPADNVILVGHNLYQEVSDYLVNSEEGTWALKLTKCL